MSSSIFGHSRCLLLYWAIISPLVGSVVYLSGSVFLKYKQIDDVIDAGSLLHYKHSFLRATVTVRVGVRVQVGVRVRVRVRVRGQGQVRD